MQTALIIVLVVVALIIGDCAFACLAGWAIHKLVTGHGEQHPE